MDPSQYEDFLRSRITMLRMQKNVSEHKMSLDLGRSGSYIRSITSGTALPSVRELFHIIDYLGVTPADFFAPATNPDSPYNLLCERLRFQPDEDLQKVATLLDWLEK